MKNTAIISVMMILCLGIAWGEDDIPPLAYKKTSEITVSFNDKYLGYYFANISGENIGGNPISYFANGKKVYFVYGFDFEGYDVNDPSLTDINRAQIDVMLKESEEPQKVASSYSIIGYSQCGLTALGYLKALEGVDDSANKLNNIDAVITISGSILGAKVLDNYLNIKGHEKVGIFARGIGAAFGLFDFGQLGPFGFLINMGISTFVGSTALEYFLYYFPYSLKYVWYDPGLKTMEQMRDMKPGSDYIKDKVVQTETITYPVKTGKKILASEWRTIKGTKLKYLWVGKVDEKIYKTATEVKPQFNPDVPVGFIVGLENKTIRMVKEDKRKMVYDNVKRCEMGFAIVEGLHVAKCVFLTGLITGSPVYAANSDRARVLCKNIDAEVADVLGTGGGGDGFIPLANQYIPAAFYNPKTGETTKHLNNVLSDPLGKGYVEMKNYHHRNIVFTEITEVDYTCNAETLRAAAQMVLSGFNKREEERSKKDVIP